MKLPQVALVVLGQVLELLTIPPVVQEGIMAVTVLRVVMIVVISLIIITITIATVSVYTHITASM